MTVSQSRGLSGDMAGGIALPGLRPVPMGMGELGAEAGRHSGYCLQKVGHSEEV